MQYQDRSFNIKTILTIKKT